MAIKPLNGNLTKFRNLKELQRYLDGLRTEVGQFDSSLKVKASLRGGKADLREVTHRGKEYIDTIDFLSDKSQFLDTTLAQIHYSFKDDKSSPATIAIILELQAEIKSRLTLVNKVIHTLADKVQPKTFKDYCSGVTKHLSTLGSAKPSLMATYTPLHKTREQPIFIQYLAYSNLKAGDYTYDKYYVVVEGRIAPSDGEIFYRVGTYLKFITPTRLYGLSKTDTLDNANQVLTNLLEYDDIKISWRVAKF